MAKFTEEPQYLSRVVLHPYTPELVPKYHSWMQSEELLDLTGSERLSLEEEVENQESWRRDQSKFTYILMDLERYSPQSLSESMIGDINLFLLDEGQVGEISVMIAEREYRGKGLAGECVARMMELARERLGIRVFVVKIQSGNQASIRLFEKLGFGLDKSIPEFDEVHYKIALK
jgi:RimJ/RimL family protein N-acetyltransferase